MRYADYPRAAVEDIARLRRRLDGAEIPPRRTDHNLIIGTWNLRNFGRVHPSWSENPGSPKRNYRALACIAEIVRRFDVVAIQEVKRDTSGIRMLVDEFLGDRKRGPHSRAMRSAAMELILEGLHQHSLLAKEDVDRKVSYSDMLGLMLEGLK